MSGACSSGTSLVLAPVPARCGVTIDPTAVTVGSTGGAGEISISTERECAWNVALSQSWVHVAQMSGQGSATLWYDVAPNRSTSARSMDLKVADQQVQIVQQPAECVFAVAPAAVTIGASGGDVKVTVSTDDFCAWTIASSISDWISTTAGNGLGAADLWFHVAANSGAERTSGLLIGGQNVTFRQMSVPPPPAAPPPSPPLPSPSTPAPVCAYSIAPHSFNPPSIGGSLQVAVTTTQGCAWTIAGTPATAA